MNRLQKKAWTELVAAFVTIVLITIPGILFLSVRNAQGLDYLLICLIAGTPAGLIAYLFETKNLRKYDEREQAIIRKAFSVSACVFIFYLLAFSFISFFSIGGKQTIPVVLMPIMVLTGVFLGQCTQSFIILIQCTKEDDESKGGAA